MAKKAYSLKRTIITWGSIIILALVVLLAFIIFMGTWYGRENNHTVLVVLIVVSLAYIAMLFVLTILLVRRITKNYRDGLYGTTIENYRRINDGEAELEDYPTSSIAEFTELNAEVRTLRSTLQNVTMIYHDRDYEGLGLEPVEGVPGAVTLKSVQRVLNDLVGSSLSFRNAFVEVYYEAGDEAIQDADLRRIAEFLHNRFLVYEKPLVIVPDDHRSVYLYLPHIDSASVVTDHLNILLPNLSVSKQTVEGHVSVPASYSVVLYPYSSVHEIFQDLRYAKRQGKMANVYLPQRHHLLGNSTAKSTMYLNQMSKLLRRIEAIEADRKNKQAVRQAVASVLDDIDRELGFDTAGIVSFDSEANAFVAKDAVGKELLFPVGTVVDASLLKALAAVQDPDHSYFFSKRTLCGPSLGRYADKYGIQSGFFYVIVKEGQPHGFIYLVKFSGDLRLDSYMQETLVAATYHIASSFIVGEIIEDVVESDRKLDALLAYTDSGTYQIEKGTYALRGMSQSLKRLFPKTELGTPCHKAFFGLTAPCPDCPLFTGDKKTSVIKNRTYASTLTLNSKLGSVATVLLQRLKSGEVAVDRYDHDLLINSFPTLVEDLRGRYLIGDTGYVLLLRVDNHSKLVDTYHSEGVLLIYRNFVDAMKKVWGHVENVYLYDSQTLAVLFSSYGQTDVLNRCEDIFKLTKNLVYEGDRRYDLELTYLPMHYPQGFASAEDFLRHVGVEFARGKREKKQDYIFFDDSDYVRPASRREFMLQVIDEQFGKETFHVLLQPIVHGQSRRIFGAEVLLRIQDEQRHIVFFPDELVRVASENGKIPTITKALLRYVSSFYSSIGAGTLKQMGFTRLGLNTDVSLFADPTFEGFFESFIKEADFPNDFLSFEIGERDVANHLSDFQKATAMLKRFQIPLVIDQYTGANFSMDDLRRLGFTHVKISRNLVHNIDVDRTRLAALQALLEEAMEKGIDTSVVGVENLDQYNLLLKINPKIDMQGFYFYAPLEKAVLVDTVRTHNASLKEGK